VEAGRRFLQQAGYSSERTDLVAAIIELVGFKSELARREQAAATGADADAVVLAAVPAAVAQAAQEVGAPLLLLMGLVQDADRLDGQCR